MQNLHITSLALIKQFVFAGHATFTLKNAVSGNRFTYRLSQWNTDPHKFNVRLLTDSDRYTYVGTYNVADNGFAPNYRYRGIKGQGVTVIIWYLAHLHKDMLPPPCVQFWHEGLCACCGRPLTVPESIASGIGPVCADKLRKKYTPKLQLL